MVTTRDGTEVYPLPGRHELERGIRLARGLLDRRDDAGSEAAAALYEDLLAAPLARLPERVERLVVLPDGALNLLPFSALRTGADAPALLRHYDVSSAPGATLWREWREARRASEPSDGVLALIDPELPEAASEAAAARSGTRGGRQQLGRLPYARREGKALRSHLPGTSELVQGASATERRVKGARLDQLGVLHFAAHAVLDEEEPARSAVVLAAGEGEDGMLTQAEIAQLELDGQVVVLSACSSASGNVLRGEGVMSLARAFFHAGARSVVGSVWPLRDDDAALFFDRFYHHVAAGARLDEAVARAQADRIADGAPSTAWAGIVVLGDGGARPYPEGITAARAPLAKPILLFVVAGALVALALLIRRSRSRRP